MKAKIAEFLMTDEEDLKGVLISLIIAIVLSPVVFKVVFADFMWWLQ